MFLTNELLKSKTSVIPLEINEFDNKIEIKAELPGFNKENINLSINENILKIEAEKKEKKEKSGFSEFFYGKMSRSIKLSNIEEDSIEASYDNGILKIEFNKINNKVKKIEIK